MEREKERERESEREKERERGKERESKYRERNDRLVTPFFLFFNNDPRQFFYLL